MLPAKKKKDKDYVFKLPLPSLKTVSLGLLCVGGVVGYGFTGFSVLFAVPVWVGTFVFLDKRGYLSKKSNSENVASESSFKFTANLKEGINIESNSTSIPVSPAALPSANDIVAGYDNKNTLSLGGFVDNRALPSDMESSIYHTNNPIKLEREMTKFYRRWKKICDRMPMTSYSEERMDEYDKLNEDLHKFFTGECELKLRYDVFESSVYKTPQDYLYMLKKWVDIERDSKMDNYSLNMIDDVHSMMRVEENDSLFYMLSYWYKYRFYENTYGKESFNAWDNDSMYRVLFASCRSIETFDWDNVYVSDFNIVYDYLSKSVFEVNDHNVVLEENNEPDPDIHDEGEDILYVPTNEADETDIESYVMDQVKMMSEDQSKYYKDLLYHSNGDALYVALEVVQLQYYRNSDDEHCARFIDALKDVLSKGYFIDTGKDLREIWRRFYASTVNDKYYTTLDTKSAHPLFRLLCISITDGKIDDDFLTVVLLGLFASFAAIRENSDTSTRMVSKSTMEFANVVYRELYPTYPDGLVKRVTIEDAREAGEHIYSLPCSLTELRIYCGWLIDKINLSQDSYERNTKVARINDILDAADEGKVLTDEDLRYLRDLSVRYDLTDFSEILNNELNKLETKTIIADPNYWARHPGLLNVAGKGSGTTSNQYIYSGDQISYDRFMYCDSDLVSSNIKMGGDIFNGYASRESLGSILDSNWDEYKYLETIIHAKMFSPEIMHYMSNMANFERRVALDIRNKVDRSLYDLKDDDYRFSLRLWMSYYMDVYNYHRVQNVSRTTKISNTYETIISSNSKIYRSTTLPMIMLSPTNIESMIDSIMWMLLDDDTYHDALNERVPTMINLLFIGYKLPEILTEKITIGDVLDLGCICVEKYIAKSNGLVPDTTVGYTAKYLNEVNT